MEQQKVVPPEVRAVINYLRSSKAGIKTRVGILNGKRIDYFKGKSAVKSLLEPTFTKVKGAPKIPDEAAAATLLQGLVPYGFYLRVNRGGSSGGTGSPKFLEINPMQLFAGDDYYAWFYEGSQWTTYVGGIAMVAVMLAGVMFPLWPPILRLGVWYLSMGLLAVIGLFIALAIVRLIFFVITIFVLPRGIWIFPQLFADVGFVDSFIPGWDWDHPKKKGGKKKKRAAKEQEGGDGGAEKENLVPNGTNTRQQHATIEEVEDD